MQLRTNLRVPRERTRHTRIVLAGTATLVIAGSVYITAIQWDNPGTLGQFGWPPKLLVGFFMSVQTRTAGFNSIDSARWIRPAGSEWMC